MQDAHTFVEPAIPGGSSSFSAFWGISTKSNFPLLSACREPLTVRPAPVAGGGHIPEALASVLVSAVGWAAEPVPALYSSPEDAAQRTLQAFFQASSEQGSSMESMPANHQIEILWGVRRHSQYTNDGTEEEKER